MGFELVASIGLILSGVVTMGVSLRQLRELLGGLPLVSEPARSWLQRLMRLHHALMVFFLLGYLATAAAFALRWGFVGHIFVGLIFAFGALFVYLGIMIQTRLVREILTTVGRLVPICANCKRIRLVERSPEDMASWRSAEAYFAETHQTKFSHGICPECTAKLYPEYHERKRRRGGAGGT